MADNSNFSEKNLVSDSILGNISIMLNISVLSFLGIYSLCIYEQIFCRSFKLQILLLVLPFLPFIIMFYMILREYFLLVSLRCSRELKLMI